MKLTPQTTTVRTGALNFDSLLGPQINPRSAEYQQVYKKVNQQFNVKDLKDQLSAFLETQIFPGFDPPTHGPRTNQYVYWHSKAKSPDGHPDAYLQLSIYVWDGMDDDTVSLRADYTLYYVNRGRSQMKYYSQRFTADEVNSGVWKEKLSTAIQKGIRKLSKYTQDPNGLP
jgi:hypothetical protein